MGRRGRSGRTQTPCQGEGREFDSRLPLQDGRSGVDFQPDVSASHQNPSHSTQVAKSRIEVSLMR